MTGRTAIVLINILGANSNFQYTGISVGVKLDYKTCSINQLSANIQKTYRKPRDLIVSCKIVGCHLCDLLFPWQ